MAVTDDGLALQWSSAFEDELATLERRSGLGRGKFRTAGRKTNDRPEGETIDFWQAEGLRQVQLYKTWLDLSGWRIATMPDGVPGIEWKAEVVFAGRPVRLVIDCIYRVGDDLVVVDYKTGSQAPAGVLQLAFYASALEKAYGASWRPKWGSFYMSRKGELSELTDLSAWGIDYFEHGFTAMNAGVDLGLFPPNVDKHCGFCSVSSYCVAVKGSKSSAYPLNQPQEMENT